MKKTTLLTCLLSAVLATTASAESVQMPAVEAGLSTLGLYVAPKIDLAPNWQARAPIYLGRFADTFDLEGNDVAGRLTSNSVALMGDYCIAGSNFRVSGGLSLGGYVLKGSATNPTLEGNSYTGTFTTTLKQKRNVAPVLSVGYASTFGQNWGFVAELGARVTSMSLSATGQEALAPADRDQFNADVAQINRDLGDVKLLPFVTIGFSYQF